ncbi:hypothetical protein [Comamonas sp. JC664]|uniref:hypothetical protein n=1 Tax=Comamonas sp. JC664 TaxID=2801917 RepID=UPI00360F5C26
MLWDQECLQWGPGATQAQHRAPMRARRCVGLLTIDLHPARLKEQAMLREMPRRYWKNLPETQLISGLVAGARSRTGLMLAAQPAAQRA